MISYKRKIRLRDLEIYLLFKNHISLGFLIIEDLKRPLSASELTIYPYKYMDDEDIKEFENVIKIYVLSDDKLSEEDSDVFREFAMDLVDCKDNCTLIMNYYVDEEVFENLPLDLESADYQMLLNAVNSKYDISNLNLKNLKYLSQD